MIKILLLAVLFMMVIGLGYRWWSKTSILNREEIQDRDRVSLAINQKILTVEVVTSPESITLGLGGRSEIGADGMLFIFPQPHRPNFWMKGMKFDIDIVWIKDKKVVGVSADVPALPPDTSLQDLPRYEPPDVVDMVLEIPAGKAAELGIVVGTILELK